MFQAYLRLVLGPQFDDTGVDDWIDVDWRMCNLLLFGVCALNPLLDVEVARTIQGERVTVENIGHDHEIAISCELIGDQLGIVEVVADHIGDAVVGPH